MFCKLKHVIICTKFLCNLIIQFFLQEVTGIEDIDKAKEKLNEFNWNLEVFLLFNCLTSFI